jgi:uncharacterized protein DUF4198
VKTLLQIGDTRTPGFDTVLGYPAELVPLENPYATKAGGRLRLRTVVDGRALANQRVVAGGRTPSGARLPVQSRRSGQDGIATISLPILLIQQQLPRAPRSDYP